MKIIKIAAVLLLLSACATSPNTSLVAAGTALSAGEIAADGYFMLPACSPTLAPGKLCKTQATVKKVVTAMHVAVEAYILATNLKTPENIADAQNKATLLSLTTPASH